LLFRHNAEAEEEASRHEEEEVGTQKGKHEFLHLVEVCIGDRSMCMRYEAYMVGRLIKADLFESNSSGLKGLVVVGIAKRCESLESIG
jgi:hypothetical protein